MPACHLAAAACLPPSLAAAPPTPVDAPRAAARRLLCVEHLEENGKPCLYLVFEYLSTDLKKYMDRIGKGPAHPLDPMLVKVRPPAAAC